MLSGWLPTTAPNIEATFIFIYRKKQIIIQNSKTTYEVASLLLAPHDWEMFMTNEKKINFSSRVKV